MSGMERDTKVSTGKQRDEFGRFLAGTGKDAESGGDDIGKKFATKLLGGIKTILTGGAGPIAVTVATAFSASFLGQLASGLAGGVAKLAHGLASSMALLPAALLAGGLALGTFRLALVGVGDALKAGLAGDTEAFTEALKGLAPEAQSVVRELVGMKGMFDQVKQGVQGNLFGPVVGQLKPLAEQYLPLISGELMNIAAAFGAAGRETTDWLRLPDTAERIGTAVSFASLAVRNLINGATGLFAAFLPLVAVGATFLPRLTDGFDGATTRLAAFMQQAADTGRLAGFIQGGLDKIRQLVDTGRRVVDVFRDLRTIGTEAFEGIALPGGNLLGTIERLVDQLGQFVRSAEGGTVLTALFATLGAVVDNVFGTLQRVVGITAEAFGPILPQILEFVEAFMDLKSAILDGGLDTLQPALNGLASALGKVLPVATALTNWLARTRPAMAAVAAVITTLLIPAMVVWIQKQGLAIVANAQQIAANARLVASWAASAAGAVASAATTAASWVAAGASMVASMAASAASAVASFAVMVAGWVAAGAAAIANAALVVASWIAMAVQAAISAAAMAIAWIIAMGPIILAVAAVIAIIALLIIHWDTVRDVAVAALGVIWNAIQGVFNWIKTNWPLLLAILTGPIGLAVLAIVKNWDTIKNVVGFVLGWINDRVTETKNWLVDRFNDVVGFLVGMPGRIRSAAAGMFDGIKDAFRAALNWIISKWNGLEFTLPSVSAFGKTIGGGSIGTPNLPTFHGGGTYKAPPGRREGLAMLSDGEKVSTPGQGGDGAVHHHWHIRGSVIAEKQLLQLMRDAKKRGDLPEFDGAAA